MKYKFPDFIDYAMGEEDENKLILEIISFVDQFNEGESPDVFLQLIPRHLSKHTSLQNTYDLVLKSNVGYGYIVLYTFIKDGPLLRYNHNGYEYFLNEKNVIDKKTLRVCLQELANSPKFVTQVLTLGS